MKPKNILSIAVTILIMTSTWARADGHSGVGGGSITEGDLKNLMFDLIPYLGSPEGIAEYPKIVAYDLIHPEESFADILRKTAPVLEDGIQRDDLDADRDCVSYYDDPSNRYFKCNRNALPDPRELKNQPSLSRLVFHEALVQAGIERRRNKDVHSIYDESGRLQFHKQTFEKMMPGASTILEKSPILSKTGIWCMNRTMLRGFSGRTTIFIWKPNGDLVGLNYFVPNNQMQYAGQVQTDPKTGKPPLGWRMGHQLAKTFGRKSSIDVLFRGHSTDDLDPKDGRPKTVWYGAVSDVKDSRPVIFQTKTNLAVEESKRPDGEFNEISGTLVFLNSTRGDMTKLVSCSSLDSLQDFSDIHLPLEEIFSNLEKDHYQFDMMINKDESIPKIIFK